MHRWPSHLGFVLTGAAAGGGGGVMGHLSLFEGGGVGEGRWGYGGRGGKGGNEWGGKGAGDGLDSSEKFSLASVRCGSRASPAEDRSPPLLRGPSPRPQPASPSAEGGSCESCSPRPGGASAGSAVSAVSGADPAGGFRGSPLAPSTRWRQQRDSSHATLCHHATHLPPPPPSPSPAIHPSPRER